MNGSPAQVHVGGTWLLGHFYICSQCFTYAVSVWSPPSQAQLPHPGSVLFFIRSLPHFYMDFISDPQISEKKETGKRGLGNGYNQEKQADCWLENRLKIVGMEGKGPASRYLP